MLDICPLGESLTDPLGRQATGQLDEAMIFAFLSYLFTFACA